MSFEHPPVMPGGEEPKKIERRTEESIREVANDKAQELFKCEALHEESFILSEDEKHGAYPRQMIQRDLEYVGEMERRFQADKAEEHENAPGNSRETVKQYGDILEALIFDQVSHNEWFGEGVTPVKTTRFDDIKHGVDILVELEHGRKPLALAIDVTFGYQGMKKKITRILDEIDRGDMGMIRYFRSSEVDYEGKLNNLPRVVIGVEMDTVRALAEQWIEGDNDSLREHFAQTLILSEISIQLRMYARYARANNQLRIAQVYETEREKIEAILEKKPDEHMDHQDRVYQCIEHIMGKILD